jgi:alpha-L-fucosidase
MGKNENSVRTGSKKEYAAYMKKFNPENFSAHDWVKLALEAGANYLLNVEPQPDGRIRPECAERMPAIGKWLKVNKKAIFKIQRCELFPIDINGEGHPAIRIYYTKKSTIVFKIIDKPKGHFADIHGIILQPV